MKWRVTRVEPLADYKLKLNFENAEEKIFDMKPYLDSGVFQKLKDETKFRNVKISFDTIEWEGNIDIEPEFLYKESRSVHR